MIMEIHMPRLVKLSQSAIDMGRFLTFDLIKGRAYTDELDTCVGIVLGNLDNSLIDTTVILFGRHATKWSHSMMENCLDVI